MARSWFDISLSHLLHLNQRPENIYAGTVDPVTKAERRAKNKVARRSRRINRKH